MGLLRLRAGAALGVFALSAFSAQAQAPATPQPPAAPPARSGAKSGANEVTVTGTRPGVTTSIDSRTYLIDRDLNASNGSVGDALRNVPSIEVDLQGNLSLRGDANVTILVDGKPSPIFSGQNRADALLNFPAKDIERVEVMTTPSAAYTPEGSGGIINLITKQASAGGGAPAAPKATGSVNAQYGSAGARRFGGNLNRQIGKLNINLTGYRNDDFRKSHSLYVRSLPNALTAPLETETDWSQSFETGQHVVNLNLRYDASPKTAITGGLTVGGFTLNGPTGFRSIGSRAGVLVSDLVSAGPVDFGSSYTNGSAGLTHKFDGDGHEFSANYTFGRNGARQIIETANVEAVSGAPAAFDENLTRSAVRQGQLKVSYKRPMPDSAKLNIGYELQTDDDEFENQLARGPSVSTRVVDLGVTNTYGLKQAVHSVYATYERPFGAFTPQFGLRVEALDREIEQVTLGATITRDEVSAYPTLNFGYKLSDTQSLRGGYSRRIQRPQAWQLNPFRTQNNRLFIDSGNPNLKPRETDAFELGYQYRSGATSYLATGYWRESRNDLSAVVTDEGNGVSLQTQANIGSGRSGGLEFVASGRLAGTLRYSLSSDTYWREIDADNLGFTQPRSSFGISGSANLTWDATTRDVMQLSATATGKRLAPQGYNGAYAVLNLGWRHKLTGNVTATLTLRDILDTSRFKFLVDTPELYYTGVTKQATGRAAFFQLSYAFGASSGAKQPEPTFDFGTAPPPTN